MDDTKDVEPSAITEQQETDTDQGISEDVPAELQRMLKESPSEVRRVLSSLSIVAGKTSYHPILEKLSKDHITKVIDYSNEQDVRHFEFAKSGRKYSVFYTVFGSALFAFFLVYFANIDKNILKTFLVAALGFLSGFGGGYGYKAYRTSRTRE